MDARRNTPRASRRDRLTFPTAGLTLFLLCSLFASAAPARPATNQGGADLAAMRERAAQFVKEHRYVEALPLLEKIALAAPRDGETMFTLSFCHLANAKILKTPEARRQSRLKARAAALKAQELGVRHTLLTSILEAVPPDGGPDDAYSANADADAAMRDGEAAYAQGELDAAVVAYQKALAHDPKLYSAALFAGDMYFKKHDFAKAAEWFDRAIKIDPDRETAYRYSASPLMEQKKFDEARARYVEAVIAEPYNRMSWSGLNRWASESGAARLSHPRVEPPASVEQSGDGQINMTLQAAPGDKLDDGSAAWTAYALTRAVWRMEKFAKEYPREKSYRHTLREEADAMRSAVEGVKTQQKEGRVKRLDPMLANLLKLDADGLLEAFILLARPDDGIAQDYPEYRKANRDKLRRYLNEYVTSGK